MTARREFVRAAAAAAAAAGLGCGASRPGDVSPLSPPAPEAGEVRIPLMAVGASVAVFAGGLPLVVTRLAGDSVVAVSRICTHMGCTVLLPAAAGQTLDCPCHGSRYRTTGAVVRGPATRALQTFPARIDGAEVVVGVPA